MTMDLASQELIKRLHQLGPKGRAGLGDGEVALIQDLLTAAEWDEIEERCAQKVASFEAGPLLWATRHTRTSNPQYQSQGRAFHEPLPAKSYFLPLFEAFLELERRRKDNPGHAASLFICKSRECFGSWACAIYATWYAQWHRAEVMIQTDREEKAKALVSYCKTLYTQQDEQLRARHPLAQESSALLIEWKTGGRISGIPSGDSQWRMYHGTLGIFDEAAFLPGFQSAFDAAMPVTEQLIALSTAGTDSFFADMCSQ